MKKTLAVFTVIAVLSVIGLQSANAFSWSNLNPFNRGKCNKCEKQIEKCPCSTGYATPCEPCENKIAPCNPCKKQETKPVPCDACDRLQQDMQNR